MPHARRLGDVCLPVKLKVLLGASRECGNILYKGYIGIIFHWVCRDYELPESRKALH